MSSVAAVTGQKEGPYHFTEEDWNDSAPELVKQLGKNAPGLLIYAASKTAAERAFWEFKAEKKPSFTMTALNPV